MANEKRKEKLQERILALQAKLESLDTKPAALNSKSEGFPELIAQVNNVINIHGATAADVIEVLLKAKRTGLRLAPKE